MKMKKGMCWILSVGPSTAPSVCSFRKDPLPLHVDTISACNAFKNGSGNRKTLVQSAGALSLQKWQANRASILHLLMPFVRQNCQRIEGEGNLRKLVTIYITKIDQTRHTLLRGHKRMAKPMQLVENIQHSRLSK